MRYLLFIYILFGINSIVMGSDALISYIHDELIYLRDSGLESKHPTIVRLKHIEAGLNENDNARAIEDALVYLIEVNRSLKKSIFEYEDNISSFNLKITANDEDAKGVMSEILSLIGKGSINNFSVINNIFEITIIKEDIGILHSRIFRISNSIKCEMVSCNLKKP